jgi:hypothetical protein
VKSIPRLIRVNIGYFGGYASTLGRGPISRSDYGCPETPTPTTPNTNTDDMSANVGVDRSAQASPNGPRPGTSTSPRSMPRLPLIIGTIVVSVSTVIGVRPVSDPSPWLHLKVGAFLLEGGRFGMPDPWAPFASYRYVPTEWLPAVLGQLAYQTFGLPGIAWMRCAGILGLLSALVWSARRSADTTPALVVAFVALIGAYDGLTERPQLLGLVFLAVAVGAWWRSALDLKPRWWLVPMTWLWACSHGLWSVGLVVGLVTIAGLIFDRRLTARSSAKLFTVPVLCVAAAGLTPLGPRLLLSPLVVDKNAGNFVGEWQSTSVHNPVAVLTLAMLGLVLLSWFRMGRKPPWWQIGLLLTGLVATLAMTRTIAVGAIIGAPLLANEIQLYRSRPVGETTRQARSAWIALILTALVAAAPLSWARAQDPVSVPDRLRPQLALIPPGTVVLAEGDIGGWLFWSDPQVRLVLDPRIEIYSAAHVRAFVSAMATAPGWRQFVDRTGARYALVVTGSPIATSLIERAGWTQIGEDAGFVLLRAT